MLEVVNFTRLPPDKENTDLREVVNLKQYKILTYDFWLSILLLSQQFVFSKIWKGFVSKETLVPEQGENETLNKLTVVKLLLAITKTDVVGLSHTLNDQRESVTFISLLNSLEVPYLPIDESIQCIS